MIPLVMFGLGGGALMAGLLRQRTQPTLLDQLSPPHQGGEEQQPSENNASRELQVKLSNLDDRFQALVQTYLDPFMVGQLREEQMREISPKGLRELNPQEKAINRRLALGVGSLVLVSLKSVTRLPLTPVILVIGLLNAWPMLKDGWVIAVNERRFSLMHLMLLYILSLWLGGNYLIGTVGVLLSSLGHKFEWLTQIITRHSLIHLLGEQPTRVWVKRDGEEQSIPFEELLIADILVLTAGQQIPVDGVVVHGSASVDQHRLTGESQPVDKIMGDPVLAATLVLAGKIDVRVEKAGAETVAARIGEVLDQTVERQEIRIADQFKTLEKYRWPTLGGSAIGLVLRGPKAALEMLGCNFMVSQIPLRLLTLLNGLGTGAERGVLIKDGRVLERLPNIDTIVFDKTGTLTLEKQHVAVIHAQAPYGEIEVLTIAAAAEQRQNHPIAQAILSTAEERKLKLPAVEDAAIELGLGIRAQIGGQTVRIGSQRFLTLENLELSTELMQIQTDAHSRGHGLVFVAVEDELVGAMELASIPRPEAMETVAWLKQLGFSTYILSGDQEAPTAALAADMGMDGWFANTLPEQKAEKIRALREQGRRVCFLGDGINDAIALRLADVSISFRGATTVATDSAQVVLMKDDLRQLKVLWDLSEGFGDNLSTNARQAGKMSILAAIGVLILPFGYWTVEILWAIHVVLGIKIARLPLIKAST